MPHVHILIWLQHKLRPQQIDQIISTEIPDPNLDPELHRLVIGNMIHGHCSTHNPSAPCMKNGRCDKNFPKNLIKDTLTNEKGYPLYRRRSPDDGGFVAKITIRSKGQVTIDNSWVVPYCPLLLKMYKSHINVESCNSVSAIKYIMKYIMKGSDNAMFGLQMTGNNVNIDNSNEVKIYQSGGYVCSNEAVWRILYFSLHERFPTVISMAIHLENGQRVIFNQQNLAQQLQNPPMTTLTAFFDLCQNDAFARRLLYHQIPQYGIITQKHG